MMHIKVIQKSRFLVLACLAFLGACTTPASEETAYKAAPDFTIKVQRTEQGELRAIPPNCPGWGMDVPPDWMNSPMPMLGCATARNLAAMIADPADLVNPKDSHTADATAAAASIQRYRRGEVYVPHTLKNESE